MIIKGLFKRYERWNPVHPTFGAFWGMGIGIGCGVGWGPGFGPEVIGYVGAGCGIGFSVGITLAGIGIGLPANFLFRAPYNAIKATRSYAPDFSRYSGLFSTKDVSVDAWNDMAFHIASLQKEACGRFSRFKQNHILNKRVDFDMKRKLHILSRPVSESLHSISGQFFDSQKGSKD